MKIPKTKIMKALLALAILITILPLPALTEQEGVFTESKIDLVYEESFAIIMVVTNSTPIRVTLKEMQKKIAAMRNTRLTLNMGGTNRLKEVVGIELSSYAEGLEDRLDSVLDLVLSRDERALEIIGDVINAISGVPGPKQYRKQQEAIKKIQQLMLESVANQKKDDEKFAVLGKVVKLERKQMNLILGEMREIRQGMDYDNDVLIFRSEILTAGRKAEMQIKKVENIIQEGKHGKIAADLLNFAELNMKISDIKDHYTQLTPIFMREEVGRYYDLELVKIVISRDTISSFVRIPLINFSNKMRVRPIKAYSGMIDRFLLTSADETAARLISNGQLDRCLHSRGLYISDLRRVEVYSANFTCDAAGCEIHHMPTVLHEIDHTRFSYIMNGGHERDLNVACREETGMKTARLMLPEAGTIYIPMACSARGRDFAIFSAPQEEKSRINTRIDEVKIKEFSPQENGLKMGTEKKIEEIEKTLEMKSKKLDEAQVNTQDRILRQQEGLEALGELIQDRSATALFSGVAAVAVLTVVILTSTLLLWRTIRFYHN